MSSMKGLPIAISSCLLMGCVTRPNLPARSVPPSTVAQPTKQVSSVEVGRADNLTDAESQRRAEGLAAMDQGQFDRAETIFESLLRAHPGNASVDALLARSRSAREQTQGKATLAFANIVPVVLEGPPWAYSLRRSAPIAKVEAPPRLRMIKETRNQITDDDDWFAHNGLRLPAVLMLGARSEMLSVSVALGVTAEEQGAMATANVEITKRTLSRAGLPMSLPAAFGISDLILAIESAEKLILIYGEHNEGRYLAVVDAKSRRVDCLFDFQAFLEPPSHAPSDADFVHGSINWAALQDGVLYVSTGHRTYARSSLGKNAFVSAIEVPSGRLLWQSAPLVANASNFLVRGGYVLSGYGFTDEKDFLFVLDGQTGREVGRVPLRKSPSYLIEKDGQLFVRTYSYDYVFSYVR
jgi:hypothetical protein